MGFGVPVGDWFRGPLKELLMDTLGNSKTGYFNKSVIDKLIDDHISRRADNAFQLWNLLMLELWYGEFVN
ncbi:MAG: hypothetical protein IPJ07_10630 [Acidobacteria bacterium]|nr:hypothetical protein [Acidobacteriota bacterium]